MVLSKHDCSMYLYNRACFSSFVLVVGPKSLHGLILAPQYLQVCKLENNLYFHHKKKKNKCLKKISLDNYTKHRKYVSFTGQFKKQNRTNTDLITSHQCTLL